MASPQRIALLVSCALIHRAASGPTTYDAATLMQLDQVTGYKVQESLLGSTASVSDLHMAYGRYTEKLISSESIFAASLGQLEFEAFQACSFQNCANSPDPTQLSSEVRDQALLESHLITAPCDLPLHTDDYSLITKENATVHASTVRTGLAVGGYLIDGTPTECAEVGGMSIVQERFIGERWNFTELCIVGQPLGTKIYWPQFEFIARQAEPKDYAGGYKVVVFMSGGTYNTESFYSPGLDAGTTPGGKNIMVVFNTDEDVVLDATDANEPFMATVLAPFSKVTMLARVKKIDGTIVAREFGGTIIAAEPGSEEGKEVLSGNTYAGPITCTETWTAPPSTTPAPKFLLGCSVEGFTTMGGCKCMTNWTYNGADYACCSMTPDRTSGWCPVREGADCPTAVKAYDGTYHWDACTASLPGMPGTPSPAVVPEVPAEGTITPGTGMPATMEPLTGTAATMPPSTGAPVTPVASTAGPGTIESMTAMPGTMPPVTSAPGTPATVAPLTGTPATMLPETSVPGTPATVAPLTGMPATMLPETSAPGTPATVAPLTGMQTTSTLSTMALGIGMSVTTADSTGMPTVATVTGVRASTEPVTEVSGTIAPVTATAATMTPGTVVTATVTLGIEASTAMRTATDTAAMATVTSSTMVTTGVPQAMASGEVMSTTQMLLEAPACASNTTEHGCKCRPTWRYAGQDMNCCQYTMDNDKPWCYVVDGMDCPNSVKTSENGGYWDNCEPYEPTTTTTTGIPTTTTTTAGVCMSNVTEHGCHCMETWLYAGQDQHCCQHTPDNKLPWCYVMDGAECPGAIKTSGEGGYWDNCAAYSTTTTTTGICLTNVTDHGCHCMDTWLYAGQAQHCCQRTPDNDRPWCYVADGVVCEGAIKTSGDGGYWDNCPEQ